VDKLHGGPWLVRRSILFAPDGDRNPASLTKTIVYLISRARRYAKGLSQIFTAVTPVYRHTACNCERASFCRRKAPNSSDSQSGLRRRSGGVILAPYWVNPTHGQKLAVSCRAESRMRAGNASNAPLGAFRRSGVPSWKGRGPSAVDSTPPGAVPKHSDPGQQGNDLSTSREDWIRSGDRALPKWFSQPPYYLFELFSLEGFICLAHLGWLLWPPAFGLGGVY